MEDFSARDGWPFKRTQLHKQLADAGILQREDGNEDAELRLTCRRLLGGGTRRVLIIARAHFEEAISDPEAKKKADEAAEVRRGNFAKGGVIVEDHDAAVFSVN